MSLPKANHRAVVEHVMAPPRAEGVLESECWDQDELSEMKSLLQRAEQRMKRLDSANKHTVEATNSYKYATAARLPILRI